MLMQMRNQGVEVKALNFKQLHRVLECAGEKKLKEIQLCLEGKATICLKLANWVGGFAGISYLFSMEKNIPTLYCY